MMQGNDSEGTDDEYRPVAVDFELPPLPPAREYLKRSLRGVTILCGPVWEAHSATVTLESEELVEECVIPKVYLGE